MGVDATTYLIHGFVLNEEQSKYVEKNWSEDDLPLINYVEGRPETEGHILLIDGMCGEYIIFGKVLATSDQEETIKTITIPDYSSKQILIEHFLKCFPKEIRFANEIDLMMVTHYS